MTLFRLAVLVQQGVPGFAEVLTFVLSSLLDSVYFSISSLLTPALANPAVGKPGKWTVLVKPDTQVLELLEQQW